MNTGLTKIRKLLTKKNADVFWLPNHEKSGQPDTHYLSGFTGSDSHLLITKNRSYLLTDGRYLVAAKKETFGFNGKEIPALDDSHNHATIINNV